MENNNFIMIEQKVINELEEKIIEFEASPGIYGQGMGRGIRIAIDLIKERNFVQIESE